MNMMERAYNARMDSVEAKQVEKAAVNNQVARKVVVTDLDMPFGSMVSFMVKWALAAIPATFILGIFFALTFAIVTSMMGTFPY